MSLADDLIALEQEGWEALSGDGGGAYYRARLARDARMAFSFGVLTREQAIEAIESAPQWERFELRDLGVVPLGADAGVVVYAVEAERAGHPPYTAVVSSTYVREDGAWKLAFHQRSA